MTIRVPRAYSVNWGRRGRWLRGRTFSSRERPLLLDRWSRPLLPPHQYPRQDRGRGVMAWSWRGPYRILPLPCIRRSTTAIIHGCRIRKRCVIDLYCSFGYHPCSSTRTHVAVSPPLSPPQRFGIADCLKKVRHLFIFFLRLSSFLFSKSWCVSSHLPTLSPRRCAISDCLGLIMKVGLNIV